MRATITKCFLILVLLALPTTNAIAQPPTPEATPTPTATGPIRVGPFALSDLVGFATLVGIIIIGLLSGYTARVLGPMQRREVELLERELECAEREKESLASVLREQKAYLEMQLRDAKEKANIPHDLTLPSEPISLDPEDRQMLQQLLSRLERIESVSIAAGVETPPPDPWEHISEGNLHYNLQQYEQAIQNYNRALELKPDLLDALNNRGNAFARLGQYQRAIQDYDRALELKPDFLEALVNRGTAYVHLGQYELACKDFDRALELKPDYPDALDNRGVAYSRLGRYERALQDLNRALELSPDHPNPRYNMACVYSLMNKPDEALKWLREAIDRDQDYVGKAKTDSDFDNIRDDPRFKELVGE